MTKLKPITTTSWLVISEGDERVGLLTTMNDKYTLMVKNVKQRFSSKAAVNEFFKQDVFSAVIISEPTVQVATQPFIKGYPVDWDTPFEAVIASSNLPLYSKRESSNIYFSAGYYCLEFPKLWQGAYCPKFTTLQAYNYLGPFKTMAEMKLALNRARKANSDRDRKTSTPD